MMNTVKLHNLINTIMAYLVIVEVIMLVALSLFFFLVFTGRIKIKYTSVDEKCKDVCTTLVLKEVHDGVVASKIDCQYMEDAFIHRVATEALRNHGKYLLNSDDIHQVKAQLAWIARKYWWIHVGSKAKRESQSSHVGEPL